GRRAAREHIGQGELFPGTQRPPVGVNLRPAGAFGAEESALFGLERDSVIADPGDGPRFPRADGAAIRMNNPRVVSAVLGADILTVAQSQRDLHLLIMVCAA